MHLTCPNCGGMTRTNERSGGVDERCVDCQWIFVGRVELEALLAVKARFEHADAQEAVGAPLYEALASGADHRADHHGYHGGYRADYAAGYHSGYHAGHQADDHSEYRREYRTGGRPSSRPYLRVVPSLPPDPPPPPISDQDPDPVGPFVQDAGLEHWFERPTPRLEPVRPVHQGRHRHEWSPLAALD